ncbi:MAG: 1-(5-phosphoribosyl)-5-[(5-phosphoribosylamino)methylideneamino]imidazole-4-carboxamide isomerase [Methanolinea sp.]|nr:1-(5-phosphoribosyl)-5-[(5-phosphoribosylamino)methylideneamino]imidazole-4-carboxamide isomerase [Methanolinea sp.]
MRVFPAVDILDGQCVQLVQGKRETAAAFGDPLKCARRWLKEGADALHVINLDGAFGDAGRNAELIRALIEKTGVEIQLGGGIRSYADAKAWLMLGVERVILGTLAIRDPGVLTVLSREFGRDRIMAGVDARGGEIAIEGWQKGGGDYLEWAFRFEDLGAGSLLYTNVDVEGLCQGVALDPVERLLSHTRLPVTVAGGITSTSDITGLKNLGTHGIVLGSALYSAKLKLADALEASR